MPYVPLTGFLNIGSLGGLTVKNTKSPTAERERYIELRHDGKGERKWNNIT